jgi:uncharacterized protein
MISKTAMLGLVKAFRSAEVDAALSENRALLAFRDERGRNWLHVCCGTKPAAAKRKDSIKTAEVLLRHGHDIDREAFTEGEWKATPLWFAISRGENLDLARFLLKRGCNPNYCLFAAGFRDDVEAIRLLASHGADVNRPFDGESPLLGAIKWSHFRAAKALLELGADPDYRDPSGMTALHYMLKKSSDRKHFEMMLAHGARGDVANAEGVTAIDVLSRKKELAFRRIAERLFRSEPRAAGARAKKTASEGVVRRRPLRD